MKTVIIYLLFNCHFKWHFLMFHRRLWGFLKRLFLKWKNTENSIMNQQDNLQETQVVLVGYQKTREEIYILYWCMCNSSKNPLKRYFYTSLFALTAKVINNSSNYLPAIIIPALTKLLMMQLKRTKSLIWMHFSYLYECICKFVVFSPYGS